jgi:hypothetical protein
VPIGALRDALWLRTARERARLYCCGRPGERRRNAGCEPYSVCRPDARTRTLPTDFRDPNVSGIQGNIFLDYYKPSPGAPLLSTLPLTAAAVKQGQPIITTSFSSKSEGSLHLSLDGHYVTYMGYNGAAGLEGVSNSETMNPNAQITGATGPFYDRAVALVKIRPHCHSHNRELRL